MWARNPNWVLSNWVQSENIEFKLGTAPSKNSLSKAKVKTLILMDLILGVGGWVVSNAKIY